MTKSIQATMAGVDNQGIESMMALAAFEDDGGISSSQEDILARSPFLGQEQEEEEGEDEEKPPLTQEDLVTMCSLPFTQSQSLALLDVDQDDEVQDDDDEEDDDNQDETHVNPCRKPRVCARKVRGSRISTRTRTPSPGPTQRPPQHQQDVDSLHRAVLMIPTAPTPTPTELDPIEHFVALARQRDFL